MNSPIKSLEKSDFSLSGIISGGRLLDVFAMSGLDDLCIYKFSENLDTKKLENEATWSSFPVIARAIASFVTTMLDQTRKWSNLSQTTRESQFSKFWVRFA